MTSKKRRLHSPASSQTSASDEDVIKLREKISSVAWVQCDNMSCLKWRKVRKEVAQELAAKETTWTCDKNEDLSFNSCSVPEEDTAWYDRMARRANLDILKSELKPGTLVWAKVNGYCKWPALITADPLNGKHADGDEVEIVWYHVEFVGGKRSHGWVRSKYVEVFGPGNIHTQTEANLGNPSGLGNKKKLKKGKKASLKGKDQETYKKNYTGQDAIKEALELLPLKLEQRLETCWFLEVNEAGVCVPSTKAITSEKTKKQERLSPQQQNLKRTVSTQTRRSNNINVKSLNAGFPPRDQTTSTDLKSDKESLCVSKENHTLTRGREQKSLKKINIINPTSKKLCNKSQKLESSFSFPSSLLDVSKEERLMIDVQLYKKQEHNFAQGVIQFMSLNGLKLSAEPTWQNVKISYFSLFLAVDELNGYVGVCEKHQWASVYTAVAHQYSKSGGSVAKKYYKRNLYPYEMYLHDQDYSLVVKELKQSVKLRRKKTSVSESGDSSVCAHDRTVQSHEEEEEDDDFDSPDVIEELNELEQILKTLEKTTELTKKNEADQMITVIDDPSKFAECYLPLNLEQNEDRTVPACTFELPKLQYFPALKVATGSDQGLAAEPAENAQVVPELDFPSSVTSSSSGMPESQEDQVFHELQKLEYDMDILQEQIDCL